MAAKYLLRFDDICPTMNWVVWSEVERILLNADIQPILAVIPDNQDPKLMIDSARADFWEQVRKWQSRGWTIGLHGHQHLYTTKNRGVVGTTCKSEFAGVVEEEQERKLNKAMAIFRSEGISPQVWIAPSHSFDLTTIHILRRIGLCVISDGFGVLPHVDTAGMLWIPQQLWRFRWRPFGLWTVCCHHSSWSADQLKAFDRNVQEYRGAMTKF
jgi:predicted deacetylase